MRARILSILASLALGAAVQAQSTAFTYQGRLKNGAALAAGLHDFRFTLFNVVSGGVQVTPPQCVDNILVTDGFFTTTLDFGQQFVTTEARFVQIEVRADTGLTCANPAGLILLGPRQPLAAAPIATHAKTAFSLAAADGSPTNAVIVDNAGNVGIGTATPQNSLHAVGNAAALRLQDDGDPASFSLLEALQPGQMRLNNVANAGISLIDINPMSLTGTANAHLRFFRETNTTGVKSVIFHSGNNTSATSAVIGVGGGDSVFQLDGGKFGIGTSAPNSTLDVRGTIRLGTNGEYFAVAGSSTMRVLHAAMPAPGLGSGPGYFVTHPSTGHYSITFDPPFFFTPTVTASTFGSSPCLVTLGSVTGSGCTLNVMLGDGTLVDRGFHFIVVGSQQ